MEEIIKDLKGFEGIYKISNLGNVYVRRKERVKGGLKKTGINAKNGYTYICLTKDGKQKTYLLHRLVAENFLEPIPGKTFINHKDFNKQNNRVDNLEYVSRKENYEHYLNNSASYPNEWRPRKVARYTLDGKFVKMYDSTREAAADTNDTHVSEVCRGRRKQSKGYTWKYVD